MALGLEKEIEVLQRGLERGVGRDGGCSSTTRDEEPVK